MGMHPSREEYYYNSITLNEINYTTILKHDTAILVTPALESGALDGVFT